MTGLCPGPEAPILREHLQNFVFMITLLLLLLLLLLSPLSARRLINTALLITRRGFFRRIFSDDCENMPLSIYPPTILWPLFIHPLCRAGMHGLASHPLSVFHAD